MQVTKEFWSNDEFGISVPGVSVCNHWLPCCRRRGGYAPFEPLKLYFWGLRAKKKKAFFNNLPKIKMCCSHFNCNFSFLGCYIVPVCLLFNNQLVTLPFLTILARNLMLCLKSVLSQCARGKSSIA